MGIGRCWEVTSLDADSSEEEVLLPEDELQMRQMQLKTVLEEA